MTDYTPPKLSETEQHDEESEGHITQKVSADFVQELLKDKRVAQMRAKQLGQAAHHEVHHDEEE